MTMDLIPNNKELEPLQINAFKWPIILESCNYLFPEISVGPKYLIAPSQDERFNTASLSTNDGFAVSAYEAAIMARMIANRAAIQHEIIDDPDPIVPKIPLDEINLLVRVAIWMLKSEGFEIR